MTRELFWLTLTVILTGLLWVPYVLNRCQVRGLGGAMANPSRGDKPHAEWATRLMFAHDNAIENLIVLTGHPMLVPAAIDAVRQWHYRPYILNNEPVEVETQITVNFSLAGN